MSEELVPYEVIDNKIYLIRGQKVMLDRDLAQLYEVPTRRLNEQVNRNIDRFPEDFMFSLTRQEIMRISQIATSLSLKYSKHVNAFTEHGILMLSSVLNSKRAIGINIQIMRAFVKIREILSAHKDLAAKIDLLEKRVFKHDSDIRGLVRDIRRLSLPKPGLRNKVGFFK
jgi:hypothetical protein